MTTKEKLLLSVAALYLMSGAAAYAQVSVQLNLGEPAYAIAPAYVSPYPSYYDPHHRNHDFGYWQAQRRRGHPGGHEDHRR